MAPMSRNAFAFVVVLIVSGWGAAQQGPSSPPAAPSSPSRVEDNSSPDQNSARQDSRSDRASDEESSSSSHRVDITPPKNDEKDHPFSASAEDEAEPPADVQEFHPWDPHRAAKNVEVGEFYLKRKNYRAAESRFREALVYKSDDALAMYRLGEALEKQGRSDEARSSYGGYLKILPQGPLSQDAHKAIDRLSKKQQSKNEQPK